MQFTFDSFDLNPNIAQNCMADLSIHCAGVIESPKDDSKNKTEQQMHCLADKLEKLTHDCREAFVDHMQQLNEDITLSPALVKKCTDLIEKKCHGINGLALNDCIFTHIYDPESPQECKHAYEFFELMSKYPSSPVISFTLEFKSWDITPELQDACEADAERLCARSRDNMTNLITCMSKHRMDFLISTEVLNETIPESSSRFMSQACIREMGELRKRMLSTTKLDPELAKTCEKDIEEHCIDVVDEAGQVIECLRRNSNNLRPKCHALVFEAEMETAMDNDLDYALINSCYEVARTSCPMEFNRHKIAMKREENARLKDTASKLIDCLSAYVFQAISKSDKLNPVDEKCFSVVLERARERLDDYRLDPSLTRSCDKDIKKHCSKELEMKDKKVGNFHGQVMHCLRMQYSKEKDGKPLLEDQCREHVHKDLVMYTLTNELDPILADSCHHEIKNYCDAEAAMVPFGDKAPHENPNSGSRNVAECLKAKMLEGLITSNRCRSEVLRLVGEGESDVVTDPVLFTACASDLNILCSKVPAGKGRQMNCLLSHFDAEASGLAFQNLSPSCRSTLKSRKDLWAYAARIEAPESISEMIAFVSQSRVRNSIF
ncbi:hypothetical protein Ciccas_012611, partial [Cichlidogyrus casuarinus]